MRTVNGKPVDEDQNVMIVDAVKSGLDLKQDDVLLDLCCGNGALTDRFFRLCRGGVGVDFSEALIEVARRNFQMLPDRSYELLDVEDFVCNYSENHNFTKGMCYGSFMYLPEKKAKTVLKSLYSRFKSVDHIYIGNLPDRELLHEYLKMKSITSTEYLDPTSPVGIWRTKSEFEAMAKNVGWKVSFSQMPASFYSAAYRYDALLYRGV